MPITKEKKQEMVGILENKISRQKSVVFINFSGLKAKALLELRKELKSAGSELAVFKKTLMRIVFKEKGIDINFDKLRGETALIFGFNDEIFPAKAAYDFSKKNKELKILGGVLENEFKEEGDIVALAQLPSRPELLAKFVGTINAPISGFVGALSGSARNLVFALNEIGRSKS